jgi:hypothetical protein
MSNEIIFKATIQIFLQILTIFQKSLGKQTLEVVNPMYLAILMFLNLHLQNVKVLYNTSRKEVMIDSNNILETLVLCASI